MRKVNLYSLFISDRENHRAVLERDGRALPVEVDGVILEAQFELSDGRVLLWLTDDSPYDEGLHVYLLGRDDRIEDSLEAGAVFVPGILKIGESGEDWVEFEFFKNEIFYRLEVSNEAGVRLFLPAGWKYKKLLSTHKLAVREVRKGGA
ncbi:MAG TPA: hypothetical protein VE262_01645 [Blastocatellia bacterium]|nr:hypothetical protein [Blastocatellia bacterium]